MCGERFEPTPITQKLSKISEVMSDGFYFIQLRDLMEKFERDMYSDPDAAKLVQLVEQFHRLCLHVERK